jgi:hypothetical protein
MSPIITSLASIIKQFGIGAVISSGAAPAGLTATGGVISDYTDPGPGLVYRAHVFTSTGSFVVSALSNIPTIPNSVDYLVVAGGGGGGGGQSGGGGSGGYKTSVSGETPGGPGTSTETALLVTTTSYTISVGSGGVGGFGPATAGYGAQGTPSFISGPNITTVTSTGGGGGANLDSSTLTGGPGGSGGGASHSPAGPFPVAGGIATPSPVQGYNGGAMVGPYGSPFFGAGGGGAGGAGGSASPSLWGQGGVGKRTSIAGPQYSIGTPGPGPTTGGWLAGGGGGGGNQNFGTAPPAPPNAGDGGGGEGVKGPAPGGISGTYATGGGGGGGPWNGPTIGGNGGSGIVVVRYQIAPLTATAKATGGLISFFSGKTIHTFTSSGTFTMPGSYPSTPAQVLVVAGGGSGGARHGGGGGGGGIVHLPLANGTLANGTYNVVVGGGGAATRGSNRGIQGSNSSFGPPSSASAPTHILSIGGGYGGFYPTAPGGPGGSGGGAGSVSGGDPGGPGSQPAPTVYGTSTGYGTNGGNAAFFGPDQRLGGGGGGAGGAGVSAGPTTAGDGGPGVQIPIASNPNNNYYWAGGGGGGNWFTTVRAGNGGLGGGGGGGHTGNNNTLAGPGTVGTGGTGGLFTGEPGYNPTPANGGNAAQSTGGGGGAGAQSDVYIWPAAANGSGSGGSGIVIIAYPS